VYFFEVAVGDVCVDLCGCDVGVSEECLYGAEVGAVLKKVGREAVANDVRGDLAGDAGKRCVLFDNSLHAPRSEAEVFVFGFGVFGIFPILDEHRVIEVFSTL